jgi:hypothetical protein
VIVHGFLIYGISALRRIPSSCQQNLIVNFVIIVDLHTILVCHIKISLALPIISYFVPVGYEQNVEEHVAFKYCRAWRGFKDCMIGRANGPCRVVKEDIKVIGGYCHGHVKLQLWVPSVLGLNVSIPKLHLLVDSLP